MRKLLLFVLITITFQLKAQCWKQVKSGTSHVVALKEDGTLWGWGNNSMHQLGMPADKSVYTIPVQNGNDSHWIAVDAGFNYTLAQKDDGTLWATGTCSEMGINSTVLSQVNTITDIKSFSCAPKHTLLLKTDGTLWAWGDNTIGVLGIGSETTSESLFPIQIGTDNNWKSVSTSIDHALAVKYDGTLWEWGMNNTNINYSPVQVGTDHNWQEASAGLRCSAAIKNDGTLWTWGANNFGVLGNGTTLSDDTPLQLGTDTWQYIQAGYFIMHGVKANGTLWGWGQNEQGGIGNGLSGSNTPTVYLPVLINLEQGFMPYALKMFGTAFLNDQGILKICGENIDGSAGTGTFGVVPVPSTVDCNIANLKNYNLSQLTLYPNPTSNILHLANAENVNIENITVTDITGKTVLIKNGNIPQLDMQQLPNGMYFLNITAVEGSNNLKFIKQ